MIAGPVSAIVMVGGMVVMVVATKELLHVPRASFFLRLSRCSEAVTILCNIYGLSGMLSDHHHSMFAIFPQLERGR